MAVVYTGGTFDLFHAGHVNFLKQCKRIAGENGKVIVSLNRDEFVTRYKGVPPVYPYEDRATILTACRYVDGVIENFMDENSLPAIRQISPDFIVIGSDWACKDYYTQMGFTQDWLDDNDIGLIYVPYTEGISTTELKKRIAGGR